MYSTHPSVVYAQAILRNLKAKTGRSLDEWLALLKKEGPATDRERRDWLKKNHALGQTTASMLAERSVGKGFENTDVAAYLEAAAGYVEAMYAGKESLRPAHDYLISKAIEHFPEVKISPCATIVPLYRNHVFAQIKPATKGRLELGLCLKGFSGQLSPRLVDTGGLQKGDRITHRFELAPGVLPDSEMLDWMKIAYDLDA
ncbi:MAG: DUF4287 domain-containing protein [Lewinellaceae bacterium]|nr:DUF4287 domain-containing protein [Lewinellaceae bacterium]